MKLIPEHRRYHYYQMRIFLANRFLVRQQVVSAKKLKIIFEVSIDQK